VLSDEHVKATFFPIARQSPDGSSPASPTRPESGPTACLRSRRSRAHPYGLGIGHDGDVLIADHLTQRVGRVNADLY